MHVYTRYIHREASPGDDEKGEGRSGGRSGAGRGTRPKRRFGRATELIMRPGDVIGIYAAYIHTRPDTRAHPKSLLGHTYNA